MKYHSSHSWLPNLYIPNTYRLFPQSFLCYHESSTHQSAFSTCSTHQSAFPTCKPSSPKARPDPSSQTKPSFLTLHRPVRMLILKSTSSRSFMHSPLKQRLNNDCFVMTAFCNDCVSLWLSLCFVMTVFRNDCVS